MTHIKVGEFEGPYDLLLSLISENKLHISELALSEVTEQYLAYLDSLEEYNPADLADFLVVATKLLFLKSKHLLPQFATEEDDGPSLEEQLKLYKAFVEASKKINTLWLAQRHGSFRVEPPRKADGFVAPTNLDTDAMHQSMVQLVKRLAPPKALPQTYIDKAVSMKQKIDHVRSLLKKKKTLLFSEVIESSQNKTEVIVGFLALLELVKQRTIGLSQEEAFGDIVIRNI